MEAHLYWVSAITYAIVLGIMLFSEVRVSWQAHGLEKSFRVMCTWVIFFCVQDAVWGLCEAKVIKSDTIFFISSCVFHMSTVITTFFWLKYVLDYLGEKAKYKKFYLILDIFIICCELLLVVINCFETTLFAIVDGNYVTGAYRPLTFVNQYVVYLVIGLTTLILALNNKDRANVFAYYRSVFIFTLAPILLGLFQLLFPDAPFYSMGYFFGCFIIHIFIVAHDRELYLSEEEKLQRITALNHQLEKKQAEIDGQFNILKSIAGAFDYINLVDFETSSALRFDEKEDRADTFDIVNDPHTSLNKKKAAQIDEIYFDKFLDYTNLAKLPEKMKGKKLISDEFKYVNGDWVSAMYIRIGEDVNAPLDKVAYALRNITGDRKREEQVYSALTHMVYSLHIFDLENDSMERLIESDIFKKIVGNEESAQRMSNTIMKATCKDEYLDIMLDFVNLSTVSERMQGKPYLTCEFVGKYHGWTRMTFVPIEVDGDKVNKIVVTTEIIESEKTEMINLIYKSSTDELTRLYNRRMYEEEIDSINESKDMEKLVIVAMDLNGLKTVNDNLGHKAGDELIIGAGKCIKDSLRAVGKVYRTGGDEFMGILRCDTDTLKDILKSLDQNMEAWKGVLVDRMSISYGYAAAADEAGLNLGELVALADKRMYEAKSAYYIRNGINRRRS